jgi:hypothetical protein
VIRSVSVHHMRLLPNVSNTIHCHSSSLSPPLSVPPCLCPPLTNMFILLLGCSPYCTAHSTCIYGLVFDSCNADFPSPHSCFHPVCLSLKVPTPTKHHQGQLASASGLTNMFLYHTLSALTTFILMKCRWFSYASAL